MRKKRYDKIAPNKIDQSFEELRKEFPAKLVNAYVTLHNSNFNDKLYPKYKKELDLFLKDLKEDKIEQGKALVRLVKATFDLVKKEKEPNEKKEKEKTVKAKKPKRYKRR